MSANIVLQQDIDFQAFSDRYAADTMTPEASSAALYQAMDEHIFGPALGQIRSFYANRWVKSRASVPQFALINAGYIPAIDLNARTGKAGSTFCAGIFHALAVHFYEIACYVAYHYDLTTWQPREISKSYRLFGARSGQRKPAALEAFLSALLCADLLSAAQRRSADLLSSAMLRFVWTHEVQHILCGHVDYMRENFSLAALSEIDEPAASVSLNLEDALLLRTEFEMTADILAAFQVLSDDGEIRNPVSFSARNAERSLVMLAIILVMYAWLWHDIRRSPGYFTPYDEVVVRRNMQTQPISKVMPGKFALAVGSHPPTPIRYHNLLRILSLLATGRLELGIEMKAEIDRDSIDGDLRRIFRCIGHLSRGHDSFRLMLHSQFFAKTTTKFFDHFGGEQGDRYAKTVRLAREIHAAQGHELDRSAPSVRINWL